MIKLSVTEHDINAGVLNSPTADPIALAAQRAGLIDPVVGRRTLSYTDPRSLKRFVTELDWPAQELIRHLQYGDRFEVLKPVTKLIAVPTHIKGKIVMVKQLKTVIEPVAIELSVGIEV